MSVSGKNNHLIKTCVDRRFTWSGSRFVWSDPGHRFKITVEPTQTDSGTDIVRVHIIDLVTNLTVKDWSHDVYCGEGDWRDRLQALTGKLLIKAQHRPVCPHCRVPMRVKQTKDGARQFFGCTKYNRGHGCHHTKDLSSAFDPDPESEQAPTPPRQTRTLPPPPPTSSALSRAASHI